MSADKLFEGLELNLSDATEAIWCVVELSYFESNLEGKRNKVSTVLNRVRQCLGLKPEHDVPPHLVKLVNDALSQLGRKVACERATSVRFLDVTAPKKYLIDREERRMYLPVKLLSRETKNRIYSFLATPIRADIIELQNMRNHLVDANKPIKKLTELLQTLARQFDIREPICIEDRISFLRASLAVEKARYNDLKQQFENVPESEDAKRLENRLKQSQKHVSELSAELQGLIRKTTSN